MKLDQIKKLTTQVLNTINGVDDTLAYKLETHEVTLVINYGVSELGKQYQYLVSVYLDTLHGCLACIITEKNKVELTGDEIVLLAKPYLEDFLSEKRLDNLKSLKAEIEQKLNIKDSRDSLTLFSDLRYIAAPFKMDGVEYVDIEIEVSAYNRLIVDKDKNGTKITDVIRCRPVPKVIDMITQEALVEIFNTSGITTIDELLAKFPPKETDSTINKEQSHA